MESHRKFAAKEGLSFPLLADQDHTVARAYGTWVEKTSYGRRAMGTERSTFHIDKEGKLAHIWRGVSPNGHADDVLETLQSGGG